MVRHKTVRRIFDVLFRRDMAYLIGDQIDDRGVFENRASSVRAERKEITMATAIIEPR